MQAAPDPGVTLTDCMQGVFHRLTNRDKKSVFPLPFWMEKKNNPNTKKPKQPKTLLYIINYFLICSKKKATSGWKLHCSKMYNNGL